MLCMCLCVCVRKRVGRGSVVGIATRHRLDGTGIESQCVQGFPNYSKLALESTRPPVQFVSGLSPANKAARAWR
jgi:hypothetical protein